MRNALIVS